MEIVITSGNTVLIYMETYNTTANFQCILYSWNNHVSIIVVVIIIIMEKSTKL